MYIWNPRNIQPHFHHFNHRAPFRMIWLQFQREGLSSAAALRLIKHLVGSTLISRPHVDQGVGSKLSKIERKVAFLHSHQWEYTTQGTWLNLYRAVHCYGGPEEGGWWYWMFEPVNGKRIDHMSPRLQEEYRLRVNRTFGPPNDNIYRGEYLLARVETGCPKFPGPRPQWG